MRWTPTFILVQLNVLDPEMVLVEAIIWWSDLGIKIRKEHPRVDARLRILKPLQKRSEGSVCSITRLLALLQKLLHRHFHAHTHSLVLLFSFLFFFCYQFKRANVYFCCLVFPILLRYRLDFTILAEASKFWYFTPLHFNVYFIILLNYFFLLLAINFFCFCFHAAIINCFLFGRSNNCVF